MRKLGMLVVGAILAGAIGCDDGVIDKSENALRCSDMCKIVDKCVDWSDAKEEDCRQECRDRSTEDSFESKVKSCQQCLDKDKSCAANTIDCAAECAGVVAVSAT